MRRSLSKTIFSLSDLDQIRLNLGGKYCVKNDIDARSDVPFNVIGSDSSPFTGTLDGNNNSIDGLTLKGSFFYSIGSTGLVTRFNLTNVHVNPTYGGEMGPIAIVNSGSIESSSSTGTASTTTSGGGLVTHNKGKISDSFAGVPILCAFGFGGTCGGLVSTNDTSGSIIRSFARANISSCYNVGTSHTCTDRATSQGGFAGSNSGTIEQCYSTGSLTGANNSYAFGGGFVAINDGSIKSSYSATSLQGTYLYAAGFSAYNTGNISHSFAIGVVESGAGFVSGQGLGTYDADGWDFEATRAKSGAPFSTPGVTRFSTAQLKAALPPGFDPSAWSIVPNFTYPYLKWQKGFLAEFPVPNVPDDQKYRCDKREPKCTAFNVNIVTVLDHSGTPIDSNPATKKPNWYQEKYVGVPGRAVTAYTGETGSWSNNYRDGDPSAQTGSAYTNDDYNPFVVNGHYVGINGDKRQCGTDASGSRPTSCQCQGASFAPRYCSPFFLNYEGHSGYDYPFDSATVRAPSGGRLYLATDDQVNNYGDVRIGAGLTTGWKQFHSFYILHGSNPDDATFKPNGYATWYLHVKQLDISLDRKDETGRSYASVHTDTDVAQVGCFGPYVSPDKKVCRAQPQGVCGNVQGIPIGYHLHFEVRKFKPQERDIGGGKSSVVDPYSDDLWLR